MGNGKKGDLPCEDWGSALGRSSVAMAIGEEGWMEEEAAEED
jgi:hypothetical protein